MCYNGFVKLARSLCALRTMRVFCIPVSVPGRPRHEVLLTLTNPSHLSPLLSRQQPGSPKSFNCNTYKKPGGTFFKPKALLSPRPSPTLLGASDPSPILRTLFQVPYPVSPFLAILTKTPGVWGYSSQFGTRSAISRDCSRHFRSVNSMFSVSSALNPSSSFNLQLSTFNLHLLPRLNSLRKCNLLMAVAEALIDPRASHGSAQSKHGQRRQQRSKSPGHAADRLPVPLRLQHEPQGHRPQLSLAGAVQRF